MEKERCDRIKPGIKFFHIGSRKKPSPAIMLKCLITADAKQTKARPLLSKWRGEREVRSK